jgi:tetratricopeptide (TPR) repeat protein
MLADNLVTSATFLHGVGEIEQALALAQEGSRISEAIGNTWGQAYAAYILAQISLDQGRFGEGISIITKNISLREQAQINPAYNKVLHSLLAWIFSILGSNEIAFHHARQPGDGLAMMTEAMLAKLYNHAGDSEKAKDSTERVLKNFDEVRRYPQWAPYFVLYMIIEPVISSQLNHAYQPYLDEALERIKRSGSNLYLAELLHARSMMEFHSGQRERALETLDMAEGNAMNLKRVLLPILETRLEIERDLGMSAAAEETRIRGAAIAEFIAEHAGSEELSASFRDTPLGRLLLAS